MLKSIFRVWGFFSSHWLHWTLNTSRSCKYYLGNTQKLSSVQSALEATEWFSLFEEYNKPTSETPQCWKQEGAESFKISQTFGAWSTTNNCLLVMYIDVTDVRLPISGVHCLLYLHRKIRASAVWPVGFSTATKWQPLGIGAWCLSFLYIHSQMTCMKENCH